MLKNQNKVKINLKTNKIKYNQKVRYKLSQSRIKLESS